MAITICFDFGNTRLKAAVFEQDQLKEILILNDDSRESMEEIIAQFKPSFSILSSVINHQPVVEEVLAKHTSFHKLSYQTKLPFTTPVGKPETIGADRLALCAASVHLFPGKNNLAIGIGTCITYNFINNQNQFLGGSISPGLEMRFKSMNQLTALLPLVKMEWNFPLIGYDTKTNLLSGVAWGMAKEIDGIIDAYAEKYGNFNVLLTGGDTVHFAPLLKNMIFADPQLIFKGLYAISEFNR
ncbi:MAG: type III pantothenate kinase [Chitinophagaceae bacterium]|nr:type III pantothenate kinase [Chitinophagaceae bacterium]